MKEDHTLTCQKCAAPIRPCTDATCVNRYNHDEGMCAACEAEEQGKEWNEQ